MNYGAIKLILEKPVLKIFRMENPALLISFLFAEFKVKNDPTIREDVLSERLDFHILEIKKNHQRDSLPEKNSTEILTHWANLDFFRKYYANSSDIPFYELTPSSEKILNYILDLDKKEFVGTESRLLKIFEILKEIAYRSSNDPDIRIHELEKRKSLIESEIAEIKSGNLKRFTSTQLKERYFDLFDTSRRLLSDFREVEYNFREIDSLVRTQIEEALQNRGKILDLFFEREDFLFETDQGRSFIAFFEFLMSEEKQTELSDLIGLMQSLPEIVEIEKNTDAGTFDRNHFFRKLKFYMMNECQKVNKTNFRISDGLRRSIASKKFLENKRLSEIISEIKIQAIRLKDNSVVKDLSFEIDGKPDINLIMERPIFSPPQSVSLNDLPYEAGDDSSYTKIDLASLYDQIYIDKEKLKDHVKDCLRYETQVSLGKIFEQFPTENGLLDVVGYFSLTTDGIAHFFDDAKKETIVVFSRETGKKYRITVPSLVFIKDE